MGRKVQWPKKKIIKKYKEECLKYRKLLSVSEFKKSPNLPSLSTLKTRIGGIKNLRYHVFIKPLLKDEQKNESSDIAQQLCEDCMHDPFECESEPGICFDGAAEDYIN